MTNREGFVPGENRCAGRGLACPHSLAQFARLLVVVAAALRLQPP
jgi:hypothetical protein